MASVKPSTALKDPATNIREFILGKFPLARKRQINNSDPLFETGMLDSMGVLEIVTFIEQEYGFSVSDEDLIPEKFQAIDRIAAFIRNRMSREQLNTL
jgi:acyl carrier protein